MYAKRANILALLVIFAVGGLATYTATEMWRERTAHVARVKHDAALAGVRQLDREPARERYVPPAAITYPIF